MLFGPASEERPELEGNVIDVFFDLGGASSDGEVENDGVRPAFDSDAEHVCPDEAQSGLPGHEHKVVAPQ
ncbi:hypothetical protein [Streptomyces sp. NPDC002599]|uniref:hypothetical protein n=1 Tax=Streptomyces sp. NPDC002599 TaxID=3154421 RepID=UPI003326BA93